MTQPLARARNQSLAGHTDSGGFPPVRGRAVRVLILGSFPGEQSLLKRQYYANPHNRFWRVVAPLISREAHASYASRVKALTSTGIALWDVLEDCERRGSLDQAILRGSEVPNDIGGLVESLPALRGILFNGGAAAELFHRCVLPRDLWVDAGIAIAVLPSTSPANAGISTPALMDVWNTAISPLLEKDAR